MSDVAYRGTEMPASMPPMRRRSERRPVPGSAAFDRSNPFVYMGTISGARKHRSRPGALIVPIDFDPELFRWPVDGLPGVLLIADADSAKEAALVAGCMIRDGAEMVAIIGDGPAHIHRKPGTSPRSLHGPAVDPLDLPPY